MEHMNIKERKKLFTIIGSYLQRYNLLMIIILSVVLVINIAFTIGWYYAPDDVPQYIEVAFYISQSLLFLFSVASIVVLILNKIGKLNSRLLGLAHHIYAAFLIIWGTVAFCLDLSLGFSPLLFLLICTFVAGVFVIDPFFFSGLEALSLIPIIITIVSNHDIFFKEDQYFFENLVMFISFLLLIAIISFRNYRIVHGEYLIQKRLNELSYKDELTGLLNERSYITAVESIDNRIDKGEDVKFAVILMDVNNLKVTNDTYGHRYGCSLIVRCGHTLPTLFETSKLFHIGGDEFIVIVFGKDYDNFEETMKRFDEAMLYSLVQFEGKELIFSVARGYHIREKGQHYRDVLQIADKEMYANKKYLKEKYNMKSR